MCGFRGNSASGPGIWRQERVFSEWGPAGAAQLGRGQQLPAQGLFRSHRSVGAISPESCAGSLCTQRHPTPARPRGRGGCFPLPWPAGSCSLQQHLPGAPTPMLTRKVDTRVLPRGEFS